MRVALNCVHLETTDYVDEGDRITITAFTTEDALFDALSAALEKGDPLLTLRWGVERLAVRLRECDVSPPYSRRMRGSVHKHTISLEILTPRIMADTALLRASIGASTLSVRTANTPLGVWE